jgi:hypothetical protein
VASEDGLLRDAVGQGPDGAGRWLEGQFAVVWIAVRPERRGRGLGRTLLERLLASAGTDRAWLITHDLDTPAQALYRSLGFQQLGRGPLGWHDAERVVLGADLPRSASPQPTRRPRQSDPGARQPDPGGRQPDPPVPGPPVGRLPPQGEGVCGAVHRPPRPARCPPRPVPPGVASPRRTR